MMNMQTTDYQQLASSFVYFIHIYLQSNPVKSHKRKILCPYKTPFLEKKQFQSRTDKDYRKYQNAYELNHALFVGQIERIISIFHND